MLLLSNVDLPAITSRLLADYQALVNAKETFLLQAEEGATLFKRYNVRRNTTFKTIRETLAEMSGGTVRCNYCEDSNANQVEHIYPKKYYPERCFVWENYCYACGSCNQPKLSKFTVFRKSDRTEVNLTDLPPGRRPPDGQALLIDPRKEDPLKLLFLDTRDTFNYVPYSDEPREIRRAEYTIGVLGLNTRAYLVRARRIAFDNYKSRLYTIVNKAENGEALLNLDPLIQSLKGEHHRTVWYEMIRQRRIHPEVDDLLTRAVAASLPII